MGGVIAIKKLLEKETGMPIKKQILKFGKEELVDDDKRSCKDIGIVARTVLDLEPRADEIIFVDVKAGTLFGMDRDDVIEKGFLTTNQSNKLDFLEAAKDSAA